MRFFGEAPPERLAVVRAAVFGFATIYVAIRSFSIASVADLSDSRFEPIGPLSFLDTPISAGALWLAIIVTVAACAAAASAI